MASKPVKNIFTTLTLFAGCLLGGCFLDDDDSPGPVADAPSGDPPATESSTVTGTGVKGIIKNGIVEIYGVTDGVKDDTPLVTGTTDAFGRYSLQVDDYNGPVIVEISAGPDSVMKCDVVAGCGGIAFGEDVALDADFRLKAVVPEVTAGSSVSTNVTTLTSLAAKRAESEGSISAAGIRDANSQVATLFNITGDLTELPVVDITDPVALANADTQAQNAALVVAAILSRGIAGGTSIGQATAAMETEFTNNNGQLKFNESSDSDSITLEEIFSEVETMIQSSTLAEVDLGSLQTQNTVRLAQASTATPDSLTTAAPTDPEEADSIAAAAQLADSIRRAGIYQGATELNFLDELTASLELFDEDSSLVMEATALAVDAIGGAIIAAFDGASSFTSDDGIAVEFLGNNQYRVDTDIEISELVFNETTQQFEEEVQGTVAVSIEAAGTFSADENSLVTNDDGLDTIITFTEEIEEMLSLDLTALSGTAQNDGARMTINEATSVNLVLDIAEFYNEEDDSESSYFLEEEDIILNLSVGEVVLSVELEQLGAESPVSFLGEVSFSSTGDLIITENFEGGFDPATDCYPATELAAFSGIPNPEEVTVCISGYDDGLAISFSEVDFLLSGEFTRGSESFSATLAANLIVPEGFSFTETEQFRYFTVVRSGVGVINQIETLNDSESSTDETEDAFIAGTVSFALVFNLAGVDPTTELLLDIERTGLDDGTASMTLAFNNKRLLAELGVDDGLPSLTVTDANGNTLSLSEDAESGNFTGNIVVDETQVATITDESGLLVIRYTNGSVDSL